MVAGLASAAVVASGEDVIGAAGLWWAARRAPVTPDNVNKVQKAYAGASRRFRSKRLST